MIMLGQAMLDALVYTPRIRLSGLECHRDHYTSVGLEPPSSCRQRWTPVVPDQTVSPLVVFD